MKRLGKVFWGVLCMILLFAFSHASADNICAPNTDLLVVKPGDTVQFMWNVTKTYADPKKTHIDEQKVEVKYLVYQYKAENKDVNPPDPKEFDKLKSEGKLKEYAIIKENSMKIKFEIEDVDKVKKEDLYFLLGVQAIPFNKKNGSEIMSKRSKISWSCFKICTIKPQKVKVEVTK